jgi:hypothetical protein
MRFTGTLLVTSGAAPNLRKVCLEEDFESGRGTAYDGYDSVVSALEQGK